MAETDSRTWTRLCPRCEAPTPALHGQSYCQKHKNEVKRKSAAKHQSEPCSKCQKRPRSKGGVWCSPCSTGKQPKICRCGSEHFRPAEICLACERSDRATAAARRIAEMGAYREQERSVKASEWWPWAARQKSKLNKNRWLGKDEWLRWSQGKASRLGLRRDSVRIIPVSYIGRKRPWVTLSKQMASKLRSASKSRADVWYLWACGKSSRLLNRIRRGRQPRKKYIASSSNKITDALSLELS